MKRRRIVAAVYSVLGISCGAHADIINISFTAQFTLTNSAGVPLENIDSQDPAAAPGVGSMRTPVSGAAIYDTGTATGAATVLPFGFFSGPEMTASPFGFQAIGDEVGNASGTLLASQISLDWGGGSSIPVTIIFDGAGFLANIPAPGTTLTIGAGCAACATSRTPDVALGSPVVIGAVPIAMTTYNTAGTTPDSVFPLVDDGISGSPMTTGPFPGFNMNFDFTSLTATNVSPIPVPGAAWLFGSGLAGLLGIAQRRRRCSCVENPYFCEREVLCACFDGAKR